MLYVVGFQTDINRIVSHIKTYNYSKFAVYGWLEEVPFSVHISNHFDNMCQHVSMISFSRYEGNDKTVTPLVLHKDPSVPIFIIDDLTSSTTMNKWERIFTTMFSNCKYSSNCYIGKS